MSRVISKESLTAYQRWELGAVDHDTGNEAGALHGAVTSEEVDVAAVSLPTAEELERIHRAAWQEGRMLGLEQGRKEGYEEGAREVKARLEQFAAMTEALEIERVKQDEQIAHEILDLSLVVARQMIRAALFIKEDLILDVVREALVNLPSLSGHIVLSVHPDDAPRMREWLNTEHPQSNLRVISDPGIERGGFRFESSTSEMDGTMATRWRDIVACLGSDVRWLE
jgi:flagellar assembly protein FliH